MSMDSMALFCTIGHLLTFLGEIPVLGHRSGHKTAPRSTCFPLNHKT